MDSKLGRLYRLRYSKIDIGRYRMKMVQETVKIFGKVNIFWHNAGNAGPGVIERTSEEDFDKTLSIHVKGGFFGAKYGAVGTPIAKG
jgi:NAD(P)-dependent dehydrogenase (short-subunit alcohol dehydrogenase family)